MKRGAILVLIFVIPAITLVETKNNLAIIFAKLVFTILSASLIAPLHTWTQSISKVRNRYKQVSISYSVGKLGAVLILPVTILLFEKYNNLFIPSAIIIILALIYYAYLSIFKI